MAQNITQIATKLQKTRTLFNITNVMMEHHAHKPAVYIPAPNLEPGQQQESLDDPALLPLIAGKTAASGVGVPAGFVQNAVATVADSLHGLQEGLTYLGHKTLIDGDSGKLAKTDPAQSRFPWFGKLKQKLYTGRDRFEQVNYTLISTAALGAVAWAGVNLHSNVNKIINGTSEQNSIDAWDMAHIGATGAALAATAGIWHTARKMKRKVSSMINPSDNLKKSVNDQKKHADGDVGTTAGAFAEAGVHTFLDSPVALSVANTAVLGFAGYLAWRFRPWTARRVATENRGDRHPHAHSNHDHDECSHAHLIPHELIEATGRLGRLSKAAGSLALNKAVDTGSRIAATGRNWRQARKDARQAEIERPWWRWVENVAQSDESMQEWAASQLESNDYKQWKQKREQAAERRTPQRRRWRAALAAGVAAVTLGVGLAGDTVNKLVDTESPAPEGPVALQPERPQPEPKPKEEAAPPGQVAFTETVKVAPGESQWSLAEQLIADATGQSPGAGFTKIITALAAAENQDRYPNPHDIRPGHIEMLAPEAIKDIQSVLVNPAEASARLVADLAALRQAPWGEIMDQPELTGDVLKALKVAGS